MSGRLQNKTAPITRGDRGASGGEGGDGAGIGVVAARRFALFPACDDGSFAPRQTLACNPMDCTGVL